MQLVQTRVCDQLSCTNCQTTESLQRALSPLWSVLFSTRLRNLRKERKTATAQSSPLSSQAWCTPKNELTRSGYVWSPWTRVNRNSTGRTQKWLLWTVPRTTPKLCSAELSRIDVGQIFTGILARTAEASTMRSRRWIPCSVSVAGSLVMPRRLQSDRRQCINQQDWCHTEKKEAELSGCDV